jgi:hypothetical protein
MDEIFDTWKILKAEEKGTKVLTNENSKALKMDEIFKSEK